LKRQRDDHWAPVEELAHERALKRKRKITFAALKLTADLKEKGVARMERQSRVAAFVERLQKLSDEEFETKMRELKIL
jgi:hypothetical protein